MFAYGPLKGQETGFIISKLLDSKTKEPVPFAHVLIKNKARGLATNLDGAFRIPVRYKSMKDTLVISCIGYHTREVALHDFSLNIVNEIYLVEQTQMLGDLTIVAKKRRKRYSPEQVIQLAIDNIPENYPVEPFSYIGYYRDYQIKKQTYVNLNEAILKVYDYGFDTLDVKGTQTRIVQYSSNTNFPVDSLSSLAYDYSGFRKIVPNGQISSMGGNEYMLLRIHDAIRNYNTGSFDYVKRFDEHFIDFHEFKFLDETSINEVPLYKIKVYKNIIGFIASGMIYISKGDFKIYKLAYSVYNKLKASQVFEVVVEYEPHNNKMYPSYISFNNTFKVLQNPRFYLLDAKYTSERDNLFSLDRITLEFNNEPLREKALNRRNYILKYNGHRLRIRQTKQVDNVVTLTMEDNLPFSDVHFDRSLLSLELRNFKDVFGNRYNEGHYEDYIQYREMFVQELMDGFNKPSDNLYMRKMQPIFDDQPIAPLENLKDYWLNTPLQN